MDQKIFKKKLKMQKKIKKMFAFKLIFAENLRKFFQRENFLESNPRRRLDMPMPIKIPKRREKSNLNKIGF